MLKNKMEEWKVIGDDIWNFHNELMGKCLNKRQAEKLCFSHNQLVFQHKRLFKRIFDVCHDYEQLALTEDEEKNYKR